jgi:hypothetical protein
VSAAGATAGGKSGFLAGVAELGAAGGIRAPVASAAGRALAAGCVLVVGALVVGRLVAGSWLAAPELVVGAACPAEPVHAATANAAPASTVTNTRALTRRDAFARPLF